MSDTLNLKLLLMSCWALIYLSSYASGQQHVGNTSSSEDPPACPTVSVDCPSGLDNEGEYKATVSGIKPGQEISYTWAVSPNAKIVQGQGTSAVLVEDLPGSKGTTTVTVTIGGLDARCNSSASCSRGVSEPLHPYRVDIYGALPFSREKAHLDEFAVHLQNQPGSRGFLIVYGSEVSRRGERAKRYLIEKYGIESERIVTVRGSEAEKSIMELYLVPAGANDPEAILKDVPEGLR